MGQQSIKLKYKRFDIKLVGVILKCVHVCICVCISYICIYIYVCMFIYVCKRYRRYPEIRINNFT